MADLSKEQRTALGQTRVIWAALLLGQVGLGVILLSLMLAGNEVASSGGVAPRWLSMLLPIGLLLVVTPVGYFVRNQIYKANWQGDVVTPHGYVSGNIVLLGLLEGVGMLGLVLMFISATPVWPGLAAALAMAVQAVNFPTGEPMRPHRPDFVRSPD